MAEPVEERSSASPLSKLRPEGGLIDGGKCIGEIEESDVKRAAKSASFLDGDTENVCFVVHAVACTETALSVRQTTKFLCPLAQTMVDEMGQGFEQAALQANRAIVLRRHSIFLQLFDCGEDCSCPCVRDFATVDAHLKELTKRRQRQHVSVVYPIKAVCGRHVTTGIGPYSGPE